MIVKCFPHLAVRSGKKVQTKKLVWERGEKWGFWMIPKILLFWLFLKTIWLKYNCFIKKTQYFRFCFFSILVFRSNKILILGDRLSFQSYQISWQLQSGHAVNQPTHAHSGPIWYHQEPSDILYSCRFLQQEGSEAFIQQ